VYRRTKDILNFTYIFIDELDCLKIGRKLSEIDREIAGIGKQAIDNEISKRAAVNFVDSQLKSAS